jgi:hypothetical protein
LSSRSSISGPAYLGITVVVVAAITVIIVVEGEINHLLWVDQDLPEGGEILVAGMEDFSVFRGFGRATEGQKLAHSWERFKPAVSH